MDDDHAAGAADVQLLKLVAQYLAENAAYRRLGDSATTDARGASSGHLFRLEQRITMTPAHTLDGVIAKARCVADGGPASPFVASLVRDILNLKGSPSASCFTPKGEGVMTEGELRAQMRLYAIELLTVNLSAMTCLMTPKPRELIAAVRKQMVDRARALTFPGLDDPAMSDLFAAELEAAVDRLVEMADGQISRVLQVRERKGRL
ncbi:MAG TPA: hypothetical protein VIY51_20665 [Xanthobacteraceae bacterium]